MVLRRITTNMIARIYNHEIFLRAYLLGRIFYKSAVSEQLFKDALIFFFFFFCSLKSLQFIWLLATSESKASYRSFCLRDQELISELHATTKAPEMLSDK